MAQRHTSLIPLSRDHYEGLLLSQQIRADRIMMNGWPADPVGSAQFVVRFHDEHLRIHFVAEEESSFPLVTGHVPQASSLVEELLTEHRTMEQFVSRFAKADTPAVMEELNEFSEILERHIKKKSASCSRSLKNMLQRKSSHKPRK